MDDEHSVDDDLDIQIWPASLGPGASKKLAPAAVGQIARWDGLPLLQLSAFFGAHATIRNRPNLRPVRLALNLPVVGMPDDRSQHILRSLLESPGRVVQYLFMLLSLDLTGMPSDTDISGLLGSGDGAWRLGALGLFEALLRVLKADPRRLAAVDAFLTDLTSQPEGERLVPPDFARLWGAVQSAVSLPAVSAR